MLPSIAFRLMPTWRRCCYVVKSRVSVFSTFTSSVIVCCQGFRVPPSIVGVPKSIGICVFFLCVCAHSRRLGSEGGVRLRMPLPTRYCEPHALFFRIPQSKSITTNTNSKFISNSTIFGLVTRSVACRWAGAVFEVTSTFRHEQ